MSVFKTSAIVKSKKYPSFIKKEKLFKTESKIEKWFDKYGLKQFSIPLTQPQRINIIDNVKDLLDNEYLIDDVQDYVSAGKYKEAKNIINLFELSSKKSINNFDIKQIFKTMLECKNHSASEECMLLIKATKITDIVFSYAPFDIATMSMRGTHSCQAWTSAHSRQLIGSIYDPCCGIIYIKTNNRTIYGSEMFARSVVRIVRESDMDTDNSKPKYKIGVENPYFFGKEIKYIIADCYNFDLPNYIQDLFISTLKKYSKVPVIMLDDDYEHEIPVPGICKKLGENKLSCRDSGIPYSDEQRF